MATAVRLLPCLGQDLLPYIHLYYQIDCSTMSMTGFMKMLMTVCLIQFSKSNEVQ